MTLGWRFACLIVTAAAGAGCAGAAGGSTASPVPHDPASTQAAQELSLMQAAWRRALAARDTGFFRHVLAEEFLLTGGRGAETRERFLAELLASKGEIPPSRPEETNVRVFGDYAIVTGLIRYGTASGGPQAVVSRYTEVWVRRGGRWRALHGHYNPIQAP